jgi:ABC-type multidrug transport system ATPase subunit
LDAHVGAAVFNNCIKTALSSKTVILVTHQLHLLPLVDNIVVLDEGNVVQNGSFEELMRETEGMLYNMMKSYRLDSEEDKNENNNTKSKAKEVKKKNEKEKGAEESNNILESEDRTKGALTREIWLSFFNACGGFKVNYLREYKLFL